MYAAMEHWVNNAIDVFTKGVEDMKMLLDCRTE